MCRVDAHARRPVERMGIESAYETAACANDSADGRAVAQYRRSAIVDVNGCGFTIPRSDSIEADRRGRDGDGVACENC